jgi:hypothetical protein
MFSQVTKTSAIIKHTIHYDTIFDFGTETLFWALFLEADLDFACSQEPPIISIDKTKCENVPAYHLR